MRWVPGPAFAIGHTIFTTSPAIQADTYAHEKRHVRQYEILGDAFWVIYGGSAAASALMCIREEHYGKCVHDSIILEILAD